jgi:6-phospho-3-hexuloisomerase
VLIVASASGESIFPVQIAKLAKQFGATVVYIGSNPQSTCGRLSDCALRIPCKTKLGLPGEYPSWQPMSTLFEQTLFILGDVLAYSIMEKKHLDEKTVSANHANLE